MDPVVEERGLRLEQELHRMVEILIREYEPEKLILFGSAAQGELHEWSGLDLAVNKRTDKPLLDQIEQVLRLVPPNGPPAGLGYRAAALADPDPDLSRFEDRCSTLDKSLIPLTYPDAVPTGQTDSLPTEKDAREALDIVKELREALRIV